MMEKKCSYCLHPIAEDVKYCPDCGKLIQIDMNGVPSNDKADDSEAKE